MKLNFSGAYTEVFNAHELRWANHSRIVKTKQASAILCRGLLFNENLPDLPGGKMLFKFNVQQFGNYLFA